MSITPNPATRIPVQKVITLQLFQSGGQPRREHAQRDRHSPEPLDADDDDEQDDQTESTGEPSSSSSQGRRTLIQRMDSLEQNMVTLQTRIDTGFDAMQRYLADLAARFPPPPPRD